MLLVRHLPAFLGPAAPQPRRCPVRHDSGNRDGFVPAQNPTDAPPAAVPALHENLLRRQRRMVEDIHVIAQAPVPFHLPRGLDQPVDVAHRQLGLAVGLFPVLPEELPRLELRQEHIPGGLLRVRLDLCAQVFVGDAWDVEAVDHDHAFTLRRDGGRDEHAGALELDLVHLCEEVDERSDKGAALQEGHLGEGLGEGFAGKAGLKDVREGEGAVGGV